jgi:hypothetical protein
MVYSFFICVHLKPIKFETSEIIRNTYLDLLEILNITADLQLKLDFVCTS